MDVVITSATLKKVGLRAVQLIRARTLKGRDMFDETFKPYSKKPFAMPIGAIRKGALGKLKKQEDQLTVFQASSGAMWAVITGGYSALRGAMGRETGQVNMSLTGAMLRGMTVTSVHPEGNVVMLGFADKDSATLAYYHNVAGAGKGKTKREFFGLSQKDLQDAVLKDLLADGTTISAL